MLELGNDVVLYAQSPLIQNAKNSFKKYNGNYYYIKGDILDRNLVNKIIRKYDVSVIIHAAAITPDIKREVKSAKKIMNVNLMGTIELLEAAKENNISKFVYLSSVAIYGKEAFESDLLKEERSIPKPHNLYEISKYSAESVVRRS